MEISSFGAKANLPPKIRADLSEQAKHTSYLCLSLSLSHTLTYKSSFHCTDGNRRDEVSRTKGESWRMGRLASGSLADDLQLNADANAKTSTKTHKHNLWGADIVFISVICAAKESCVTSVLIRQSFSLKKKKTKLFSRRLSPSVLRGSETILSCTSISYSCTSATLHSKKKERPTEMCIITKIIIN